MIRAQVQAFLSEHKIRSFSTKIEPWKKVAPKEISPTHTIQKQKNKNFMVNGP